MAAHGGRLDWCVGLISGSQYNLMIRNLAADAEPTFVRLLKLVFAEYYTRFRRRRRKTNYGKIRTL